MHESPSHRVLEGADRVFGTHSRIANEDLARSSLSVRIIDSRGHNRAVDLRSSGGDRAASDLERTFGPLPPGTYRVELIKDTKPVFETSIEIRGEEEMELLLGT